MKTMSIRSAIALATVALSLVTNLSCKAQNNAQTAPVKDLSAQGDGIYAVINTTKGDIVLKLEYERCPLTVANFVGLAEGTIDNTSKKKNYFDGIKFHRVEPGFVIQGGDPQGTGSGGPGYQFGDEFCPELRHEAAGVLSMANAGPATNGSQFFITLDATPHLDGKHAVFGHVVEGMDVVMKIARGDVMKTVRIQRKGDAAMAFKADKAAFKGYKQSLASRNAEMEKKAAIAMLATALPGADGLYYSVEKQGTGNLMKDGMTLKVHYRLRNSYGVHVDNSYDRGEPLEIVLGKGGFISGFGSALKSMKLGDKRVVAIPPEMGYGANGIPDQQSGGYAIRPNAWLVFDLEIMEAK